MVNLKRGTTVVKNNPFRAAQLHVSSFLLREIKDVKGPDPQRFKWSDLLHGSYWFTLPTNKAIDLSPVSVLWR